jgi:IS5 family transposase
VHRQGKAAAEFGVKASSSPTNAAPGSLFVLHAKSLPDNPCGGHTPRDVIDCTETLAGCPSSGPMSTRDIAAMIR